MQSSSFCARCGSALRPGSAYCANCGAPVGGSPAAATPGSALPGSGAPGYYGSWNQPPSEASRAADVRSLGRVRRAAIYGMFGFVINFAAIYLLYYESFVFTFSSDCTGAQHLCGFTTNASAGAVEAYFALYVAGAIASVLAFLAFRDAFRALAPVDVQFRPPARYALLAPIGAIVTLIGLAALVAIAEPIFTSCNATASAGCYNAVHTAVQQAILPVGLVLIGSVLNLIGTVMVLLGVWRLGARFDDSTFKIAAVLLIFPFLDFIGTVLVFASATTALRRSSSPASGSFSSGAPPPPGTGR